MSNNILDGHIINIVQSNVIKEQSELQDRLKERGLDVPQATLSRRLKKLKIAKVAGLYKVIDYSEPHLPLVLNMQVSNFGMIVMHTYPGHASSLAYFLDQKYVNYSGSNNSDSGIIGTLAGDDTVLIILKTKVDIEKALVAIRTEFPYL